MVNSSTIPGHACPTQNVPNIAQRRNWPPCLAQHTQVLRRHKPYLASCFPFAQLFSGPAMCMLSSLFPPSRCRPKKANAGEAVEEEAEAEISVAVLCVARLGMRVVVGWRWTGYVRSDWVGNETIWFRMLQISNSKHYTAKFGRLICNHVSTTGLRPKFERHPIHIITATGVRYGGPCFCRPKGQPCQTTSEVRAMIAPAHREGHVF